MNRDDLLTSVKFNAESNRLALEAAAALTPEERTRPCSPSHGTVFELLKHMYGGERVYLDFCQGRPLNPAPIEAITEFDDLREQWLQLGEEMVGFVGQLDDAGVNQSISVAFPVITWHFPLWQVLLWTITHNIHHRGELSIVMTQLGHPLPVLDMMLFVIQQSGQPMPG
jgi:uncharacterized damage-inducible protein DinB